VFDRFSLAFGRKSYHTKFDVGDEEEITPVVKGMKIMKTAFYPYTCLDLTRGVELKIEGRTIKGNKVREDYKRVTVASKLLLDTMHEVKQEIRKDSRKEMAEMRAKVENLKKEMKKTSSPPESFNHKGNISSRSANETVAEKTKDVINRFMRAEFVGNHMFDDLMVPKIGRMEKKNE
nr:hypothetical protein [Tanacetum cinerariifolium]